jgi:hypothetical protein
MIAHVSVKRAPCRVQFLCARDPIARESDVFLVGLHHLAMMPRRLVAIPSTPSMLPSSDTSVSLESPGFVLANGPLILTPRVVFFRTPSVASTARWSPESSKLDSRGYHFSNSLRFWGVTRIRLYSFGWVPLEQPVDESDGHPSSLRQSWPIGVVSSLSGAEVLAGAGRFDEIAFHRSST